MLPEQDNSVQQPIAPDSYVDSEKALADGSPGHRKTYRATEIDAWPKIPEKLGERRLFDNVARIAEWILVLAPSAFIGTFVLVLSYSCNAYMTLTHSPQHSE
jgi:hypothetical protein